MFENHFRKIPNFRGKRRLFRMLYKTRLERAREINIKTKNGYKFLLPNLHENIGQDLFINGEYEPEIVRFITKKLPANGTFLDLGANIGSILIPVLKQRPDVHAIAVEASPRVYNYLEKNVLANELQTVDLVNNALFDIDDLELDFFSPDDKYGKGSLSSVFTTQSVKVKTVTIDSMLKKRRIDKIDFIKIDVEGYEYNVFKGAELLLSSDNAPDIIFEFVDWAEKRSMNGKVGEAQRSLKEFGYQLYEISEDQLNHLPNIVTRGAVNLFATKQAVVR